VRVWDRVLVHVDVGECDGLNVGEFDGVWV
jgi:hypothetical protein